uniref:flagellar filament capping protein FliD n=1 Tax=Agathobacter sp. TaxID=2021311 RepID=UPI004056FDBC
MAKIHGEAYAYYLSTYSNIKPSRYDSHKKSELRNVYNHIVKSNKESPLYKLLNEDAAARYAIDIKENAKNIQNVVASLSDNYGDFGDSFRKKVAMSNNTDIVEAKYIGDGTEENSIESFNIEVNRLASPQVNVGNYLKNDTLSFPYGSYSFDLNTGSSSYEFQFSVNKTDTNQDILKKLANLINHSTLGITATIRNGTTGTGGAGTSALALTSKQTGLAEGERCLFDITPAITSESKNAMQTLGIDKIYQEPKNSIFMINGTEHTSLSNTFTINNTFELTLKKTTENDSPVGVGFKTSNEAIADNIMSLIDAYNNILEVAEANKESEISDGNKLYNEVSGISKSRKESLASIGLIVADNGSISLDKEQLAAAIKPERAESTFGLLSRLKSIMGAKANKVSINPMNYVNKLLVAYKNPGKTFTAPYFSSVYSGIMLDRYV